MTDSIFARVNDLYPLIASEFRKAQTEAVVDWPTLADLDDDALLGLAHVAAMTVARSEGLDL